MTGAKVTLRRLRELAETGTPIVMVTAYDFVSGRVAERAGVDVVLVGDSGAQVVLGLPDTTAVTLDEMLTLAKAVRRAVTTPLVVCDLPFGSTEVSDEQAVTTSVRFVHEAGADAVKIEGAGPARLSRLRAIVEAGIPVVGHVGLTPQTATALGGLRAQGRTVDDAIRVARDALAVQDAGAFAIVIEAVPAVVVAEIRRALRIPVIGIGAGAADGQVLVQHDLLGVTEGRAPVFVKRYAALGEAMIDAVEAYASDVRAGTFPGAEHVYPASDEVAAAVRAVIDAQ
ncbi:MULTISPECIES: 3-methyl-2-oxobutanoate hydroxymethyltransferase [Microbacterium]|uniref:3-methyl-2-oxobutanoate hydroxymethyltransferase n=1 Tax=Microbacterium TaxID=33882 RepID=UPI002787221A|nr:MULTISPECIES: 3-methyl-2-oxobutanoate hydroxymethyltransferase [Microbacterium]MDQ1082841.1 3-methyl-2-oxobutanoate hydroxymethyltransferase [Microbacterium sp. SORGH_AS_0344]MDQ1168390.1 3-methyl-2-oxobutanoate hydroxymethyltransferase [Microbacterium proteolyticum]